MELAYSFSLATAITRKSFKIFTVKLEKHDAIQLLAENKLDSIADIISQVIQDGDISSIGFHKVLHEVENIVNLRLILAMELNKGKTDHKRTVRRIH